MRSFLGREATSVGFSSVLVPIEVGDYTTLPAVQSPKKLSLLGLLLFALSLLLTPAAEQLHAAQSTVLSEPIVTRPAHSAAAPHFTPPATTAPSTGVTPAAASTTTVPDCQKMQSIATIPPATASKIPGVHISKIDIRSYIVYGSTTSAINQQMARCTPVVLGNNKYDAGTVYSFATYYTYSPTATGQCSVGSMSISMNISMVLPAWQTSGAASGVTTAWNSFIRNLRTHENGHAAADQAYAQKIYTDVMALPPLPCHTIDTLIKSTIATDAAALDTYNTAYDAATQHGAMQGATL